MTVTKIEFPEGWGVQTKKPSMGGVWIFSGTHLVNALIGKEVDVYSQMYMHRNPQKQFESDNNVSRIF